MHRPWERSADRSLQAVSEQEISVGVGSPKPYWTFDLGRQLRKRGLLQGLYTMYPKSRVQSIPSWQIRSFPWVLGAAEVATRLGVDRRRTRWNPLLIESYDRWLSHRLEECTVFHCMSSFGLFSQVRAKTEFGALTVCDRGSAHISVQDRILQEEQARWGLPPDPIHPRTVHRELEEYKAYDLITVPSPFAQRSFVDEGIPPEKLRCLPFGADLSMFAPLQKEDDVFRVIYVGAMSLQKGVPDLLQALTSLHLRRFELWLIGPETSETGFILSRFPEGYRYLGMIPRHKLSWYYSQASVLVLPSVQDGFGMVMAQAMACGVPVIASRNTGVDALFADGEAGYHVPIRDPDALREAVLTLYRDPEKRARLAGRALEMIQRLGGWESYGEAIVRTYQDALASRPRL